MKNFTTYAVVLVNIFLIMASTTFGCFFTSGYHVHVTNQLPAPELELHCASGNNDLGNHKIVQGYDFNWEFCENFARNTLFFCHLSWTNKEFSFDVFSSGWEERCHDGQCYWEARTDGIYFTGGGRPFKKEYDWKSK
ncbi:hypothetical protein CDL12_02814 [Handroanthus impetiginosus]|uniref:S-protein homolog n=1 Tax=Handroanthus impetiginosus TaxID=429701 RepID=A0A2G9I3Y3_9LAMI|nr:hypothetical protein CDL12_02814 [Handroanthus impetiginosus]